MTTRQDFRLTLEFKRTHGGFYLPLKTGRLISREAKSLGGRRTRKPSRFFDANSNPARGVFDSAVQAERAAREVRASREAHHLVAANLYLQPADVIAAGGSSSCRHRIGRKYNFPGGFGSEQISQYGRWKVDSVWNEASGQLISGEKSVDDIVMAMHFTWATVAKMCTEGRARAYGNVDLFFARICVPQRNAHARFGGG